MTIVRMALVGAGAIGRAHLAHMRANPDVRVHAIVDPAPDARALAAQCGAEYFSDIAAMLAAGKPDGAIVATPTQTHVANALALVDAGIPTLVEKPVADNVRDAARLVAQAEARHVPLLTGHHRRHNPVIARARAIIESGRLGRLVSVHGFFWLYKPDDYFDIPWRRAPGAGPVLTNLIHDIDLVRHLCGEIVEVQALQSRDLRKFDVDETTVVTMRLASGALGTMNISDTIVSPWSWEHTASENTGYPRTDQTCLFIGGDRGSLSIPRLEIWANEDKRSWWEPFHVTRTAAAEDNPLRRQIAQFRAVILGDEKPLVSGREGLKTLQVIAAVQRAAETGEKITVR